MVTAFNSGPVNTNRKSVNHQLKLLLKAVHHLEANYADRFLSATMMW